MTVEPDIESILKRVGEVIRKVFRCPGADISPGTISADVDGWDSLSHVMLILECEKAFGIQFPKERLYSMKDVGELCQIIQRVLRKQTPLENS